MFLAAFTSALPAKPQAVHTKRAWLSRDFASTCPHAEHRWLVNAGFILSTRPGALSSSRRTSSPQPDPRIPRLSPALARTFRPGFRAFPWPSGSCSDLQVLDPDQVEPARQLRAGLLGPVLTPVRLAGLQPGDREPHLPAAVRAALGAGELALQPQQPSSAPAQSGRERAAAHRSTGPRTATPRSIPTAWPLPGADRTRESRRRRHASARPGPGSPGTTSRPAVPRGTSGTAPIRPSEPAPGRRSGTGGARPTSARVARRPGTPRPARLAPRRSPGRVRGSKNAAIALAKSRSACC